MQNRASTIMTVYKRFSTKQRERQRRCRETPLKSIGLISRQCCAWSVHIIVRNTTRLRMIRYYGSLRLSTILVDPFDLIPDKTPFLGFIDDAAVVEFVVDRTRQTLDDFMTWETGPQ